MVRDAPHLFVIEKNEVCLVKMHGDSGTYTNDIKMRVIKTGEPHEMITKEVSPISSMDQIKSLMALDGPRKLKLHGSKLIDGQYKRVGVTFDTKKYKTIEVSMITDVQWGAIACNEQKLIRFRDWILSEINRFVVFGGDMIDAATPLSIASPYENKYEPSTQVVRFVETMMPLAGRVLGYVGGNHEDRTARAFGPAGYMISMLMQIPYSRGKQLVDIYFGAHKPFKIDLWHGRGSARTKGAKAQMLHRFMQQGDSQLYLCGHLHDVVLLFDWRQKRTGDDITLEKIAGVMSSSFQDFWGTYAEVAGLSPSDTMMARAILYPDGKWEVTLK